MTRPASVLLVASSLAAAACGPSHAPLVQLPAGPRPIVVHVPQAHSDPKAKCPASSVFMREGVRKALARSNFAISLDKTTTPYDTWASWMMTISLATTAKPGRSKTVVELKLGEQTVAVGVREREHSHQRCPDQDWVEDRAAEAVNQIARFSGLEPFAQTLGDRPALGTSKPPARIADQPAAHRPRLSKSAKMLVIPLRSVAGVADTTCQLITSLMLSELDPVDGLSTIGSRDVSTLLDVEKQKDYLSCEDTACAAEIGGALGTDLVLYGELGAIGTRYNINLTVIDAQRSAVRARVSTLVSQNEDAIVSGLPGLIGDLIARLNATDSVSPK